jgi:hypothetical protein
MNPDKRELELADGLHDRALSAREQTINFAGSTLGSRRHICAFFSSPEEEYRVLLPFIKEGFERGEKAFHIVQSELREEHLRRLQSAGIDVALVEQEGHFELRDRDEYYFPDGRFNEDRLFATWNTVLEGAVKQGYPRTRVVAHLEWTRDDAEVLLQYEANFNRCAPCHRDPVICTYDSSKHSGAFIIDVIRTHPMIIVGGIVQENPFYVEPEEFVRELRERAITRANSSTGVV